MATTALKATDIDRRWYVVDASDRVLGRLATNIATVLRGKHKVLYSPNLDNGDFVVVVHAEKVRLTGRKTDQKMYRRHSGYPGGFREASARKVLETKPERVLREAVRGMLPKGPLGRRMLKKLKIYVGGNHPHAAQQPQPFDAARTPPPSVEASVAAG
jgi:large subunit ribosomal protein L13